MFSSLKKFLNKKKELEKFRSASTEEVFTQIYLENKWGDQESRSGKGSNLQITTGLREDLPELLRRLNIHTLLDIPCGDFHWMKELELPLEHYQGGDIVKPLIEENQRLYGNERREFLHLDLLRDPLPQADAIFCRDSLVHLCFDDIGKAVRNIRESGSTYLFATQFPDIMRNEDIVTGKHRPLNLTLPPFNWPEPLLEYVEYHAGKRRGKKCLSVWKISDLPDVEPGG